MEKFVNFIQLVDMWKLKDSVGLQYDNQGTVISVTYREMAEAVYGCAEEYASSHKDWDLIICDHSPETIYRLMGAVIAGVDVILADESLAPPVIEGMKKVITETLHPQIPVDGRKPEGRLLFFTSGTTNRSKAVVLTSASLLGSAWSGQCMLPCGEGDILLSILPLAHVFGFVCTFLWGVCYGATIALGRGVRYMMDDCDHFHPTILPVVPTMVDMLLRLDALNPELKVVLVGAAPAKEASVEALHAKNIRVYLGYGLTETSSGIAITQDQETPYAMAPCPGADIRIEEDGEISVATPNMMTEYLGFGNPCLDGRFYTGDLGRLDERGYLYITGRKKDMLVLSDGTKVYCPEYEDELAQLLATLLVTPDL
nr:AMP-binding protein [Lachnospiraceae bacterium]